MSTMWMRATSSVPPLRQNVHWLFPRPCHMSQWWHRGCCSHSHSWHYMDSFLSCWYTPGQLHWSSFWIWVCWFYLSSKDGINILVCHLIEDVYVACKHCHQLDHRPKSIIKQIRENVSQMLNNMSVYGKNQFGYYNCMSDHKTCITKFEDMQM